MTGAEKIVTALGVILLAFGIWAQIPQAQTLYPGGPGMTNHNGPKHWYPSWCCDLRDCAPAELGTVQRIDDTRHGWLYVPSNEFISDDQTMIIPSKAPDNDKFRPHVCLRQEDAERGKKGTIICDETRSTCCLFPGSPLL
jgi:hypothetical protein